MEKKYRVRKIGKNYWLALHPSGFWVGPGLGQFDSAASAMDWLHKVEFKRRFVSL